MNFNTFLLLILIVVTFGLAGAETFSRYALVAETLNGMPVRVEMTTLDREGCEALAKVLRAKSARKTLKFECVKF